MVFMEAGVALRVSISIWTSRLAVTARSVVVISISSEQNFILKPQTIPLQAICGRLLVANRRYNVVGDHRVILPDH